VNIWREIETAGGGIVSDDNLKGIETSLESFILLSEEDRNKTGLNAQTLFKNVFSIVPAAKKFLEAINS
jgi:hypothetical protein